MQYYDLVPHVYNLSSPTITEWTRAEESSGDVHAHAAVLARAVQALVHVLLATGTRPTCNFRESNGILCNFREFFRIL